METELLSSGFHPQKYNVAAKREQSVQYIRAHIHNYHECSIYKRYPTYLKVFQFRLKLLTESLSPSPSDQLRRFDKSISEVGDQIHGVYSQPSTINPGCFDKHFKIFSHCRLHHKRSNSLTSLLFLVSYPQARAPVSF